MAEFGRQLRHFLAGLAACSRINSFLSIVADDRLTLAHSRGVFYVNSAS